MGYNYCRVKLAVYFFARVFARSLESLYGAVQHSAIVTKFSPYNILLNSLLHTQALLRNPLPYGMAGSKVYTSILHN